MILKKIEQKGFSNERYQRQLKSTQKKKYLFHAYDNHHDHGFHHAYYLQNQNVHRS